MYKIKQQTKLLGFTSFVLSVLERALTHECQLLVVFSCQAWPLGYRHLRSKAQDSVRFLGCKRLCQSTRSQIGSGTPPLGSRSLQSEAPHFCQVSVCRGPKCGTWVWQPVWPWVVEGHPWDNQALAPLSLESLSWVVGQKLSGSRISQRVLPSPWPGCCWGAVVGLQLLCSYQ